MSQHSDIRDDFRPGLRRAQLAYELQSCAPGTATWAKIDRHCDNLNNLTANLCRLGIPPSEVSELVMGVHTEYRKTLLGQHAQLHFDV